VVMDAGIATADNLRWLVDKGYRYLVVNRGGHRQFDPEQSVAIETAGGDTVRSQRVLNEDGTDVRLYCHSPGREQKEKVLLR